MNARRLRNSLSMMTTGLVLMNTAWAGIPVWTFAPVSGYPASVNVSPSGTATVKYTVTNQSYKSHILKMRPIQGITSSGCASPLGYHQSCTLTLTVAGSGLKGDVLGGPILCDHGNPNQCYQPSQAHSLAIRLTQTPPVQQYTITSFAGSNGTVSPSGSQTVNSGATLTFTATPDTGYGVNQWLVDGNLAQTGDATYQLVNITANHTVNVTFNTATLTPSVSTLGLSVNCPSSSTSSDCAQKNNALTGTPRKLTITNNGSVDATNVSVSTSGLPSDALVSPSSCGTITANGGTCEITVTPGATASSSTSSVLCTTGVKPEGSVNVTADGGLSTSVDTYVLSYGCIYQGGFLYSINDATSNTGSIGGKALALTDQKPREPGGIVWDADPACAIQCTLETNAWDFFYGENLANVLGSTNPSNSGTNGPGDTYQILTILNDRNGNTNNPANYAAAVCTTYTDGIYADWYLPALCEMGPYSNGSDCLPGTPNIVNNLGLLLGDPNNNPDTSCSYGTNCLAGLYWSSTEVRFGPQFLAWVEYFASGSNSYQHDLSKIVQAGVRCSRGFK